VFFTHTTHTRKLTKQNTTYTQQRRRQQQQTNKQTKQNKTKQNKTKQNKKQNKTKQNKTKQNKQNKTKQNSGLPGDALQVAVGSDGFHLNPVAAALVFALTCALLLGVRESFHLNTATVVVTVAAILITIIAGATQVTPSNYVPFVPPEMGASGVVSAASAVFFSYLGFDMIVQGAEEAKNPARDVPIAVLVSTGVCAALYMGAAATFVGLVKYTDISPEAPFASAFSAIPSLQWAVYVGE
jgi:amino acid transporter